MEGSNHMWRALGGTSRVAAWVLKNCCVCREGVDVHGGQRANDDPQFGDSLQRGDKVYHFVIVLFLHCAELSCSLVMVGG